MKLFPLALLAAASLAQAAYAAPPSIADFQRLAAFSNPVLSPDGRFVAAIVNPDGKTTSLAVIATDKPGEATPIKAFGQADIRAIDWMDNNRLAFTVRPRVDGEGRNIGAGLWTLNRDGSRLKQWVNPVGHGSNGATPQANRLLDANWSLFQAPSPSRPGELVLRHDVGDLKDRVTHVELASLDAPQATAAGRPLEWVAYPDEGHGVYSWEHRQDHWQRIEAFLARHLAPNN